MATPSLSAARYNSTLATDPLRSFRFHAEFSPASPDGVFNSKLTTKANGVPTGSGASSGWVGGFTSIDGLSISTQNIQYREGGYNTTVHQIPGMTTFQPITFSRGVIYGNDQAITWMRGLFGAAAGEGINLAGKGFRVNIKIYVQDHPHAAVDTDVDKMVFTIHNAWITSLSYTNLDATQGQILFEQMQVVHEGLTVEFVK